MRDLIVSFLVAFVLFRVVRTFFFGNLSHANNQRSTGNSQSSNQPPKPEGEVTIQSFSDNKKSKGSDAGEYVDYEEVK